MKLQCDLLDPIIPSKPGKRGYIKGHLFVAEGKVQHIMEQSLGYYREFGMHALSAMQLVHGPLNLSMINFGLIKELLEGFDPIYPDGVAIERWK